MSIHEFCRTRPSRPRPAHAEPRDPAVPGDPFQRVRYGHGLLLGVEDFEVEQHGALLRERLHAAALHGYGTFAGLHVTVERPEANRPTQIVIEPGLAIDRLGRTIHVEERVCLDIARLFHHDRWGEFQTETVVDEDGEARVVRRAWITLQYRSSFERHVPGARAPVCEPSEHGLIPSRVRDTYRADLVPEMPVLDAAPAHLPDPPGCAEELFEMVTSRQRYESLSRSWSSTEDSPLVLAEVWLEGDRDDPPVMVTHLDQSHRELLVPVQTLTGRHLEALSEPDCFSAVTIDDRSDDDAFHVAVHFNSTLRTATVDEAVTVSLLPTDPDSGWSAATPTFAFEDSRHTLVISVDGADLEHTTSIRLTIDSEGPFPLADTDGRTLDAPLHLDFSWPSHGDE
jgi:hypothetical protein